MLVIWYLYTVYCKCFFWCNVLYPWICMYCFKNKFKSWIYWSNIPVLFHLNLWPRSESHSESITEFVGFLVLTISIPIFLRKCKVFHDFQNFLIFLCFYPAYIIWMQHCCFGTSVSLKNWPANGFKAVIHHLITNH